MTTRWRTAVLAACLAATVSCGTRNADLALQVSGGVAGQQQQGVAGDTTDLTVDAGLGTAAGQAGAVGAPPGGTQGSRPSPGAAPSAAGGAQGSGPASTGATGSPAPAPPAGGGSAAGSSGAASGEPAPPAPGPSAPAAAGCTFPRPEIRLAYVITDSGGVSALTGSDVAVSNEAQQREWEALIAHANATGGVCGAQVVGLPNVIAATSREEERIAHCVAMTEDQQADFVADTTLLTSDAVQACFAEHGVPLTGYFSGQDRQILAEFSPYIATAAAALDRGTVAQVRGAAQVGYFDGATVGVVYREGPTIERVVDSVMLPELRALGVEPAATVAMNAQNPDQLAGQAANGLVEFRAAGVDHVLMIGTILEWLAWANTAESQGYRPRYAFGESFALAAVTAFYGPHAQLTDAVAAGASVITTSEAQSSQDVSADVDPAILGPGAARCYDTLSQQTGTNYYDTQDGGRSTQEIFICDHFFLWLDAARAVQAELLGGSWHQGLARLTTFDSVIHNHVTFAPGVVDGADTYRVGIFNQQRRTYPPVTGWLPLPR